MASTPENLRIHDWVRRVWGRLPFPGPHIVGMAAGMVLQRLRPLRLSPGLRPVGWVLLIAGVITNALAVRERGDVNIDQPQRLTTSGLHRLSRNPMYVGFSAIHLGWALSTANGWILATWPVSFVLIHRSVMIEEVELGEQFGLAYNEYLERTPRYLGRING